MMEGAKEARTRFSALFGRYFRRTRHESEEVLAVERDRIEAARPEEIRDTGMWALAHSGGGIRSAAFAIGAQQALHADGLMPELDYLSTVSGGGYAGSALTWFACKDRQPGEEAAPEEDPAPQEEASDEEDGRIGVVAWLLGAFPRVPRVRHRRVDWSRCFPFGTTSVGSEGAGRQRNRFLDYLRHHSRYLTPGSGLSGLSFFGSVVQGTVVSAGVYSLLALAVMVGLHRIGFFQSPSLEPEFWLVGWGPWDTVTSWVGVVWGVLVGWWGPGWGTFTSGLDGAWQGFIRWLGRLPNWPALATGALACILLLMGVLNSVRTWIAAPGSWRYQWGVYNQRWLGRIWAFLLLAAWLAAAEGVGNWILEDVVRGENTWKAALPVLAGIGSALSGYTRFGRQQESEDEDGGGVGSAMLLGLAIFGLLFAVTMGAYLLAAWPSPDCLRAVRDGMEFVECPRASGPLSSWRVFGLLLGAGLLGGWVANLNLVGPHQMYRSRLMEAFLPNPDAVARGRWEPATEAEITTLEEVGMRHTRPFHLINTNLILPDSRQARFRGRGGDNFVLSPLFCGSSATGWYETKVFDRSYFSREGMTLATAMAVSGAALNPDAGVGGAGPTRGRAASLLLTFLNLRLGYWAPHPRRKRALSPPNFLIPGVGGGLLGRGLHEDASFLQLSDGGHFENLGLYELIRRRARVMVLTDGGADPEFEFADLANALERVRVDFGARIEFRNQRGLEDLVPEPTEEGFGFRVAKRGWAVADVWYSTGEEKGGPDDPRPKRTPDAVLYYLKTTLVDRLPADLVGYKKSNPSFPDESTADQFFTEPQFEAYRELGFRLARRMIHEEGLRGLASRRRERAEGPSAPETAGPPPADPAGTEP